MSFCQADTVASKSAIVLPSLKLQPNVSTICPVSAPYAGVVEFRDGRIIGLREYCDMGAVNALKSGEAMKEHVRVLIAREAVG